MIVRYLCGTLGLSLLCYVLLSYEDEERGVTTWISSAGAALRDLDKNLSVRLRDFMQFTLKGLDFIYSLAYGTTLLSNRAYLSSLSFATALACYVSEWHGALLAWLPILLLLVISPFIRPRILSYTTTLAGVLAFMCIVIFDIKETYPRTWVAENRVLIVWVVAAPLILGLIDFFVVAAMRRIFRGAQQYTSLLSLVAVIAATAIIAPIIVIIIGDSAIYIERKFDFFALDRDSSILQLFLILSGFIAAQSSLFLLALTMVVISRLMIAFAPRALNSILKLKILENRKTTAGIAASLIGVAFPHSSAAIEKFVKIIFG